MQPVTRILGRISPHTQGPGAESPPQAASPMGPRRRPRGGSFMLRATLCAATAAAAATPAGTTAAPFNATVIAATEMTGKAAATLPYHTVSGQSAGGSMAMQHLFAFSSSILGAGIAAGSAYGCGALPGGKLPKGKCYYGGLDVEASIKYVHDRARHGLIDQPRNLRRTPVVLFSGQNDWIVYTDCMRDVHKQLEYFVNEDKLVKRFDTDAAHVWSLDHGGCKCGECGWRGAPQPCCDVNNCDYEFSYDILHRSYGSIKPKVQAHKHLHWFRQTDYLPSRSDSWSAARLADWAFAYVPSGCQGRPEDCNVHVTYHGCIKVHWKARLHWALRLDLNEFGEANDIIIVYPQADGDKDTGSGCWNWGFPEDDRLFDTKHSVQLRTVGNILMNLPYILRHAVLRHFDDGPPSEEVSLVARATANFSAEVPFVPPEAEAHVGDRALLFA
mmetsp:Transcript_17305/g.49169  ORF Transcript_17305/g.49169 Transcript_17305/m.49169 type:complete len:444 (-) Transcript_17305:11-1342(-)